MADVSIPVRNPDVLQDICLRVIGSRPERALTEARVSRCDAVARRGPGREGVPALKRRVLGAVLQAGKLSDTLLPDYFLDPSFKSLAFPKARVTVAFFQRVARCCPALRRLHLSDCFFVDDAALATILTEFKDLRELSLEGCRKLSDDAVSHLTTLGSALRAIDVGGCFNISADGMHRLVTTHPNQARIHELLVSGTSIAVPAIQHLAEHYPALRKVGLGFSDVTEEQLVTLCANHPQLTHLHVHWCRGMGDRVLSQLGTLVPSLESLDLCGVKHLTNECLLEFVRQAYPPLADGPAPTATPGASPGGSESGRRADRPRLSFLNCKFTALSQATAFAIESECPQLTLLKNSGILA